MVVLNVRFSQMLISSKILFFCSSDSRNNNNKNSLVQKAATLLVSAEAANLVVFERELVVIGDFLVFGNGNFGVNHDLLPAVYSRDNFGNAVRDAAMVYKAR